MGIEYVIAKEDDFVTTDQINRYLNDYPGNITSYLSLFKQRFLAADIASLFDQIKKLKVLVIGDTIIDEYQFCSAIGRRWRRCTYPE